MPSVNHTDSLSFVPFKFSCRELHEISVKTIVQEFIFRGKLVGVRDLHFNKKIMHNGMNLQAKRCLKPQKQAKRKEFEVDVSFANFF